MSIIIIRVFSTLFELPVPPIILFLGFLPNENMHCCEKSSENIIVGGY